MTHRIEIPGWHPARLNQIKNNRWASGRIKKADRELIEAYATLFMVPDATGRRRVSLEVVLKKGQRSPDEDSYWKSLLDGLVKAGMLTDDNRQGVQLGGVGYTRSRDAKYGTTIVLEDIEPVAKIPKVKRERKAS